MFRRGLLGAAVLAALGTAATAFGFAPFDYYAGFGLAGRSHEAQTKAAVQRIANELPRGGVKPCRGRGNISCRIADAVDAFVAANAQVDEDQEHAHLHFDGETFQHGYERLSYFRFDAVEKLRAGDLKGARASIGQALHTLQDFYSHSTWVEQGNRSILPMLSDPVAGRQSGGAFNPWASVRLSPPTEVTCRGTEPVPLRRELTSTCETVNGMVVTSNLTTGYYEGEDIVEQVTKCHHGGIFDLNDGQSGWRPGINKDTVLCSVSPHWHLHEQAALLSEEATYQFLKSIRNDPQVTEKAFRALVGLSTTIAIIIDETESMEDVIDDVRARVRAEVASRTSDRNAAVELILVPFRDPQVGPVTRTTDPEVFYHALDSLTPTGGGDCPEASLEAIEAGLAAVGEDAQMFVFTDASPKNENRLDAILAQAEAQQVQISFSLSGNCSPYHPGYFTIAQQTGGQVFVVEPDEGEGVSELLSVASRPGQVRVLTRTIPGDGGTIQLPVDSYLDTLVVSVSGAAEYRLRQPDGTTLKPSAEDLRVTAMSAGVILLVAEPDPGVWSLEVMRSASSDVASQRGSGIHSVEDAPIQVTVWGESGLVVTGLSFLRTGGRPGHTGYYPIVGSPVAQSTTLVQASASVSGAEALDLEFLALTGESFGRWRFEAVEGATEEDTVFLGEVTVPSEPFVISTRTSVRDSVVVRQGVPGLVVPQSLELRRPPADRGSR